MRALVTGATGFLGSHVAARLVAQGHEVRVVVRPTSDLRRLDGLPVDILHGDVTDRASMQRASESMDVVFHTAALLEFGPPDRRRMHDVNVEGTRNTLESAVDAGAIAVHVSSVAVLGATGPDPVDESWWSPDPPVVAYEATKREAHEIARDLASAGRSVRVGLPGGIYGFGDESQMAKLIEVFVSYPTPVGYMPDQMQSLVNVDDCADGLILIAEKGQDGEEYLLCAEAVPFRRWFELIAAGAGRRPPFAYLPSGLVRWSARPAAAIARRVGGNPEMLTEMIELATRHQAFSGAKARRELGWSPRSLRTGMAEMATAIRADRQTRGSAARRRKS